MYFLNPTKKFFFGGWGWVKSKNRVIKVVRKNWLIRRRTDKGNWSQTANTKKAMSDCKTHYICKRKVLMDVFDQT